MTLEICILSLRIRFEIIGKRAHPSQKRHEKADIDQVLFQRLYRFFIRILQESLRILKVLANGKKTKVMILIIWLRMKREI